MPKTRVPYFIDVFAGCGGFSLGLTTAGWKGLFAVEKSPLAFETLRHNLIDHPTFGFAWPTWLPKEPIACEDLLTKHPKRLVALQGTVDLIVGGPPCQGFSMAGKRNPADPRNSATEHYLALVALLKPTFLVIENVAGFNIKFDELSTDDGGRRAVENGKSYAQYITTRLSSIGYTVSRGMVNCADFGVPQNRHRYLMICQLQDKPRTSPNLLSELLSEKNSYVKRLGLSKSIPVSTKRAIGDLETRKHKLVVSKDSLMRTMWEISYCPPRSMNAYLRLMRHPKLKKVPNSLRLAHHKRTTVDSMRRMQSICRPGKCLSAKERSSIGRLKHSTTVLDPQSPAPTITTLPDDIIHYSEPRILTVRENARLQSFPDWFEFLGKYTTGGKQRKHDCPRYTQVGNAVPPLLSRAIGDFLKAKFDLLP